MVSSKLEKVMTEFVMRDISKDLNLSPKQKEEFNNKYAHVESFQLLGPDNSIN